MTDQFIAAATKDIGTLSSTDGLSGLILQLEEDDRLKAAGVGDWLRRAAGKIGIAIKETICCKGLTKIDDPEEQKELAEKLTKAVGDLIPAPYKLAWGVLKPLVKKLALFLLQEAAKGGAKWCDGTTCDLVPLAIDY